MSEVDTTRREIKKVEQDFDDIKKWLGNVMETVDKISELEQSVREKSQQKRQNDAKS